MQRDNLFSIPITNLGNWTFDERVANVFLDMIQRSIPGYSNIISMIGTLASRFAQPRTQIYDLGCALGTVALSIQHNINHTNCRIIAVDNSPAMISRCRQHISTFYPMIPIELIEDDIRTVPIENASLVVLNFTMQFLEPTHRQPLLNRIYDGLNTGGVLVLSEKIGFHDQYIEALLYEMHHDFKRANGYNELEINQKQRMLENIMFTDTINIHKQRLTTAGFNHVEIWFQYLNFSSLIAIKSKE